LSSRKNLHDGRYTLLKKLGEGGEVVVYKSRVTVLNCIVEIKLIKSAVLTEKEHSRFIRKMQTVAKLNHPNIVSIYDISKEIGNVFLFWNLLGL